MTAFIADFAGAIVVEAAKYGYSSSNNPKEFCLHTPEEAPDDYPATPYYFHNLTDRNASTHYFVSFLGFVFQMVPESEGAYANVREMGERYSWEDTTNLNLQTLNIEIEGYAHSIHNTMPRGSPQWVALIRLIADRCKALGFPVERTFGHKAVSPRRSDPGQLRLDWIVYDVNLILNPDVPIKEEDMPLNEEDKQWIRDAIQYWVGFKLDEEHGEIQQLVVNATENEFNQLLDKIDSLREHLGDGE